MTGSDHDDDKSLASDGGDGLSDGEDIGRDFHDSGVPRRVSVGASILVAGAQLGPCPRTSRR